MEPHVEQAFRTAIFLSGGRPLNAADLLHSAILVGHDSPAFSKWASFFPDGSASHSTPDSPPSSLALSFVPMNLFLASSFEAAKEFFGEDRELWGRDYITTALLAVADPSLQEIARAADRSIESLRDEWFWFVSSDPTHAEHRQWGTWWNRRDLPIPVRPNTYLLTFDPKRHADESFSDTRQPMTWSVGNHGVRRGDRVFFMRQGQDQPGLIGAGSVVSDITRGQHWDRTKPTDWISYYARIEWDILRQLPLVPAAELIQKTGEKRLWFANGSGLPIPNELSQKLETLWRDLLSVEGSTPAKGSGEQPSTAAKPEPTPAAAGRPDVWMLSDQPLESRFAELDRFQFKDYANALAAVIDHEKTETPFTMAINAPWGAGKTTLANMIAEQLQQRPIDRGHPPHIICWFNAWMNDDAPNLATALVSEIGRTANRSRTYLARVFDPLPTALLEPVDRRWRSLAVGIAVLMPALLLLVWMASHLRSTYQTTTTINKDSSLKIISTSEATTRSNASKTPPSDGVDQFLDTVQSRIIVLGTFVTALAGITGVLAKILTSRALGSFVQSPDSAAGASAIQSAAKQLGSLISQATRGRNRFIVFVDDIERCKPPRSVDVLDAINQLMNHRGVVVVLLGDMSAVAAAAQLKYKDLADIFVPNSGVVLSGPDRGKEAFGRLYLQKIVQFQFDLPVLPTAKVRQYLTQLAATVQTGGGQDGKD
jgi:hypothetical protein